MGPWWVMHSWQKCPCHNSSCELEVDHWEKNLIHANWVEKRLLGLTLLVRFRRYTFSTQCCTWNCVYPWWRWKCCFCYLSYLRVCQTRVAWDSGMGSLSVAVCLTCPRWETLLWARWPLLQIFHKSESRQYVSMSPAVLWAAFLMIALITFMTKSNDLFFF